METIDIIKKLCADKGISIAQLESDLGYGNGSIAKSKTMLADRMYQISQYFNVSMEYLITGKTLTETDSEISILRQQQSVLMEINKISGTITDYYRKIDDCKAKLSSLQQDYMKLEAQKRIKTVPSEPQKSDAQITFENFFDMISSMEDTK